MKCDHIKQLITLTTDYIDWLHGYTASHELYEFNFVTRICILNFAICGHTICIHTNIYAFGSKLELP